MHAGRGQYMYLTMHHSPDFGHAFRKHDHHYARGRARHGADHACTRSADLAVPFRRPGHLVLPVVPFTGLTTMQSSRVGRVFRRHDYTFGRVRHIPDHASVRVVPQA